MATNPKYFLSHLYKDGSSSVDKAGSRSACVSCIRSIIRSVRCIDLDDAYLRSIDEKALFAMHTSLLSFPPLPFNDRDASLFNICLTTRNDYVNIAHLVFLQPWFVGSLRQALPALPLPLQDRRYIFDVAYRYMSWYDHSQDNRHPNRKAHSNPQINKHVSHNFIRHQVSETSGLTSGDSGLESQNSFRDSLEAEFSSGYLDEQTVLNANLDEFLELLLAVLGEGQHWVQLAIRNGFRHTIRRLVTNLVGGPERARILLSTQVSDQAFQNLIEPYAKFLSPGDSVIVGIFFREAWWLSRISELECRWIKDQQGVVDEILGDPGLQEVLSCRVLPRSLERRAKHLKFAVVSIRLLRIEGELLSVMRGQKSEDEVDKLRKEMELLMMWSSLPAHKADALSMAGRLHSSIALQIVRDIEHYYFNGETEASSGNFGEKVESDVSASPGGAARQLMRRKEDDTKRVLDAVQNLYLVGMNTANLIMRVESILQRVCNKKVRYIELVIELGSTKSFFGYLRFSDIKGLSKIQSCDPEEIRQMFVRCTPSMIVDMDAVILMLGRWMKSTLSTSPITCAIESSNHELALALCRLYRDDERELFTFELDIAKTVVCGAKVCRLEDIVQAAAYGFPPSKEKLDEFMEYVCTASHVLKELDDWCEGALFSSGLIDEVGSSYDKIHKSSCTII